MNIKISYRNKLYMYWIVTGLIALAFLFSMIHSSIQFKTIKEQYNTLFSETTKSIDNKDMPKSYNIYGIYTRKEIKNLLLNLNFDSEINNDNIEEMSVLINELYKYENRKNRSEVNKIYELYRSILKRFIKKV